MMAAKMWLNETTAGHYCTRVHLYTQTIPTLTLQLADWHIFKTFSFICKGTMHGSWWGKKKFIQVTGYNLMLILLKINICQDLNKRERVQRGANGFNASLVDLKCIQTDVTDFWCGSKNKTMLSISFLFTKLLFWHSNMEVMIPLALFCYPTSILVGWHRSGEFKSWLSSSGHFKS